MVESYKTSSPGRTIACRPAWVTTLEPAICRLTKMLGGRSSRANFGVRLAVRALVRREQIRTGPTSVMDPSAAGGPPAAKSIST